jgi:hypothetical protein
LRPKKDAKTPEKIPEEKPLSKIKVSSGEL